MLILLFFISLYFVMDGIRAKKKEGKYKKNILSYDLGIVYSIIILLSGICRYLERNRMYQNIIFFISSSMILLLIMYIWNHFLNVKMAENYDKILILGCGLLDGNRVPNILRKRLEKGIRLYQMQPCAIIVSGGQGSDETISEAQAMKDYLLSKGILEQDIILEDKATSTMENMLFSKPFIRKHEHCVIVSSEYHLLRSYLCAKKADLSPVLSGSKTASYYFLSAFIREIIIMLWMYRILFLIVLLLMLIVINS